MFRRRQSESHQENDSSLRDAKVRELRDALGPLSERSLKYCTDACLRRYLEAQNWNFDKAKKALEETIKWRATYKPEEIRWHEVAHEGLTGKVSIANFHDRQGRNVLIMRPAMQTVLGPQNTISTEDNVRHFVYLIEKAILNMPEGQEQMSWLTDFNGWTLKTSTPIKTAREVNYILQKYYLDRIAISILYNPPRIFEAFWKVLKYFMDPKLIQKMKFVYPNDKESVEVMKSFFDMENLPSEFGGKATLKYDHEEFSRLMVQQDVKTAEFWGFDYGPSHDTNGQLGAEGASDPVRLAPPSS